MADSVIGRLVYKIVGDDKDYQKALRRSKRALDRTGREMQQIGARLSLGLTAPIAAAGAAAVRAAVDLEESLNAVNVVFGESAEQIEAWGETAADAAGISQAAFNQSAVRLGASLKNAGVPIEDLADQTINLTQRAADLASVFNTDVNDALGAIQAAIRGEGDPIERFGASINAAAVEAKALELGLADTKAEITEQIKVQARLALIMEQTADVAGDFANTSDNAANRTRILRARVTDLAAELGQELLPYVQAVLERTLELVDKFGELDDQQKQNIVRAAAFAAALGPVITALGTAVRVAGAAKVAFAALAANPVVLAIGALASGVVVLGRALDNAIDQQRADDMERFADAAERAGVSAGDLAQRYADAEVALDQQLAMGGDLAESVRQVADYYGVALEDVVEIARTLPGIGQEHDDLLRSLQAEGEEITAQRDAMRQYRLSQIAVQEAVRQQREDQEAITDELEEQRDLHRESWDEYWADVNQRWRDLGQNIAIYRTNLQTVADLEDDDQRQQMLEDLERMLELDVGMLTQEQAFPVVAEARRQLLADIRDLMGEVSEEADEQIAKTEQLKDVTKEQRDLAADLAKIHGKQLAPVMESIIDDAQSFTDVYGSLASAAGDAWGGVFQGLGQAILDTEQGLEAVGQSLAGMFVGILNTLGAQFAAMAAGALFGMPPTFIPNPGQAASYAAASAGFYAAAGLTSAITAFADGGSFIADRPTMALFGEAGPEYVDIQPVNHAAPPGWAPGGGQPIVINGDVYGYDDFARHVERATSRASRTGRIGR